MRHQGRMLDTGFAESLHRSGFAHRASTRSDGQITYRLADGTGHVLVTPIEWQKAMSAFATRLKQVKRFTTWLSIALFPGILVFGMTIGQVLPGAGLIILLAMFGGPLLIYLRHSRAVQQIAVELDQCLARNPTCAPAPRDRRRQPRWLEIAFLVLVGPGLLISIAGEVGGPDLFRGTPLWGAGIGWVEGMALLLIALRLARPRLPRPRWRPVRRTRSAD